jgi:hypothetical protein
MCKNKKVSMINSGNGRDDRGKIGIKINVGLKVISVIGRRLSNIY